MLQSIRNFKPGQFIYLMTGSKTVYEVIENRPHHFDPGCDLVMKDMITGSVSQANNWHGDQLFELMTREEITADFGY